MMLVHELGAWSESCRGAHEQAAALDQACAELGGDNSVADYEPERLLAAFERAKERATAERILPEFWRILDTEGVSTDV